MPWLKENPTTKMLKSKEKTICKFKRMIDKKQLPSSVVSQYICAIKCRKKRKFKMLAAKGAEQPFNLRH